MPAGALGAACVGASPGMFDGKVQDFGGTHEFKRVFLDTRLNLADVEKLAGVAIEASALFDNGDQQALTFVGREVEFARSQRARCRLYDGKGVRRSWDTDESRASFRASLRARARASVTSSRSRQRSIASPSIAAIECRFF